MALPRLLKDLANIAKLPDMPNRKNGGTLDANEFKAEFDKAALDIQAYINNELLPQVESDIDAAALGVGVAGNIDGSKLADSSVAGSKLATGTITGNKLADKTVTTDKVADNGITGSKIAASAIGSSQLAENAVQAKHIASGAVGNSELATAAVSNEKIGTGAINERTLADSSVTAAKIAANAVSSTYTATIPTSGWTMDSGWGYVDVTVSGILATDTPIIDVDLGAVSGTENILYAAEYWGNVFRVRTYANAIRIHAYEVPKMNIPIKMAVIRK